MSELVSQQSHAPVARVRRRLLGATMLFSAYANPALAQEQDDRATAIEDIVVTAQKRSESAQRVPIAISAYGGEDLKEKGLDSVVSLPQSVPSLRISMQWGRSNPNFFMRGSGVSNFDETISQSVGVYLDENYIGAGAAQLAQFYDIDRVEVLRGPQGTLFGRNTTAGAISIFTKRPGPDAEGYLEGSYGNYGALKVEGGYTQPLADGLSARFSIFSEHRDGWWHNLYRDRTDFDRNDLTSQFGNTVSFDAARLKLTYERGPTDFDLTFYGSRDRSSPTNGKQLGANLDPSSGARFDNLGFSDSSDWHEGYSNVFNSRNWVDVLGSTLRINSEVNDALVLTSVTGWLWTDRYARSDCDKSSNDMCQFSRATRTDQYSQELRLNVDAESLNWLLGVYGSYDEVAILNNSDLFFVPVPVSAAQAAQVNDPLNPGRFRHRGEYHQRAHNEAVFGQIDWRATDRLTLTAGLRYSSETKKFTTLTQLYDPISDSLTPFLGPIVTKRSWGSVSWRLSAQYQASPRSLFYASANHGFKSGGFPSANLSTSEIASSAFAPETVTTLETGTKLDLLVRRLRVNASVYYSDFKNMQVFNNRVENGVYVSFTNNAGSARVYGAEAEVTALLTDDLEFAFSGDYLHGRYHRYSIVGGGTFDGNPLVAAPDWSGNLNLSYRVHIGRATVQLRGDMNFTSRVYFDQTKNIDMSMPSNQTFGARLALTPASGDYSLQVWVRNLTDRAVLANMTDLRGLGGYYERFYETPRTFGVTIRAGF